jgi:Asp-tRNA(Asn)/Glu-tRNA(Gln) amidotransferase A subunit family amidase
MASLGPMARTVTDAAILLDSIVGYDPEDPVTAMGVDQHPHPYVASLDAAGLRGARIGVLRESMGVGADPDSDDFAKVSATFDQAVAEIAAAGATVVDPVTIPDLKALLAKRAAGPDAAPGWDVYFNRSANPPYRTKEAMLESPDFEKVVNKFMARVGSWDPTAHYEYLVAREELRTNLTQLMADLNLDAIVHKSAEHQPTLLGDRGKPGFVAMWGATHLNTFLVIVPSISVPIGFTSDELPVGMTFLGRPFSDAAMIKFAYAYEQATHHRRVPDFRQS